MMRCKKSSDQVHRVIREKDEADWKPESEGNGRATTRCSKKNPSRKKVEQKQREKREGGVLKRAGHTEASVELAILAGLEPVAAMCEVVDADSSMPRLPKLGEFTKAENIKIISIADLVRQLSRQSFPYFHKTLHFFRTIY